MKKTLAICLLLLLPRCSALQLRGRIEAGRSCTPTTSTASPWPAWPPSWRSSGSSIPILLWVDAGDLFSGTAISNLLQGKAEEAAVLELGLDAIALGNHDFD